MPGPSEALEVLVLSRLESDELEATRDKEIDAILVDLNTPVNTEQPGPVVLAGLSHAAERSLSTDTKPISTVDTVPSEGEL